LSRSKDLGRELYRTMRKLFSSSGMLGRVHPMTKRGKRPFA
jgi:hypothetical protein